MTAVPFTCPLRMPRRKRVAAEYTMPEALRRALNVSVAAIALILLLPLMLLIAVAVKLSSRGPVFYTQTRVGLNRRRSLPPGASYRETDYGGKPFRIFKFRTMMTNAPRPGAPAPYAAGEVWATPDDPRITRVGRILRLYRLDELPQLVNVLLGDMDVVGPRPEQPSIFARLRGEIDRYQDRQQVRPGITGWAQINQHYDQSVEDVRNKLRYDLQYIRQRSVSHDLAIMLRTFGVVTRKQGAL